jgi:hypothetical protein
MNVLSIALVNIIKLKTSTISTQNYAKVMPPVRRDIIAVSQQIYVLIIPHIIHINISVFNIVLRIKI